MFKCNLSIYLFFSPAIPNAAFFFSAISTQERKKGSINHESDVDNDEHDEINSSPLPSTSSQQDQWKKYIKVQSVPLVIRNSEQLVPI